MPGMTRLLLPCALLILALTLMGSSKRDATALISIHLETSQEEYPKFAEAVKMGEPARQYFFQRSPLLTDRDVVWFYPFIAEDNTYGTAFQLNRRGAEMLKRISLDPAFSGKLLGVYVMPLSNKVPAVESYLQIDRPVSDGIVVIWKGLSDKHLRVFAKRYPNVKDLQGR